MSPRYVPKDAIDGGGGRAALFIERATSTHTAMSHNHNDRPSVALDPTDSERQDELARLLRAAVGYVARQLMVTVPPSQRTPAESQFLSDCARRENRRAVSETTLATLLTIQARAAFPHALSEEIRKLEVQLAPVPALCPLEASRSEDLSNAPLNHAQLLAAEERTPTRWSQVRELALEQLHRTRLLADAAARAIARATTHPARSA